MINSVGDTPATTVFKSSRCRSRTLRNHLTPQHLNNLGLPLNPRPTKNVAANFRLGSESTLFPRRETEPPENSAAAFWNFVLNEVKRVVLRNCWFHHNLVPLLYIIRIRPWSWLPRLYSSDAVPAVIVQINLRTCLLIIHLST